MTVAVLGTDGFLALGTLPPVFTLNDHRRTIVVFVDLDACNQTVTFTHASLDVEVVATVGAFITSVARALTRTDAHAVGRAVVQANGLFTDEPRPAFKAFALATGPAGTVTALQRACGLAARRASEARLTNAHTR
jgi:hypothetical protein